MMGGGAVLRPTPGSGAHATGRAGAEETRVFGAPDQVVPSFRRGLVGRGTNEPPPARGPTMTQHRSFKQLVRARMARTGERYTTARAVLLAGRDRDSGPDGTTSRPVLATSDERVRERTGRGWEEWFDLLDDAGLRERPHREVARWLAAERGLDPLAWGVQAVVGSYDRARRGRQVGQHDDGFSVSVQRTVAGSPEAVFGLVDDDGARTRWLPDLALTPRTTTAPRRARFDADDGTRVHVTLDPKDGGRCTVTVAQLRLPDAAAADAARTAWRGRLDTLRDLVAGGAR